MASKQAIFTLTQLHAEMAGKFAENRNAGVKIKTAMMCNGGTVTGIGAPARWGNSIQILHGLAHGP
jgi:hypothetical protein